jgi:hypothetical protein
MAGSHNGLSHSNLHASSRLNNASAALAVRFASSEWFMAETSGRSAIRPHGEERRAFEMPTALA